MSKLIYLNIKGMHCAGCANTITNALKRTQGVADAKVSLELKKAKVLLNKQIPLTNLTKAIQNVGYQAQLE